MSSLPGVYPARKKNGEAYYRASITHRAKHISLGSFPSEAQANEAYHTAAALLGTIPSVAFNAGTIEDYAHYSGNLTFDKWVVLINFRDNGIYCRTPIYLQHRYFIYYLDPTTPLKFDTDDLFFYMNHKIMQRGGHLFVADYGMQLSLLSRYGIHSHAVCGRDYRFANGDSLDYRYGNLEIINRYHGVTHKQHHGRDIYTAKIHINGDFIIGRYSTEEEAAAAYNKAANLLRQKGFSKNFPENYIENCDEREYARLYAGVRINKKLRAYIDAL